MGFNNSIYKAYMDLATFGPMESMMYSREYFSSDKVKIVSSQKNRNFLKLIIFILFLIICFLYFFVKEIKHQ